MTTTKYALKIVDDGIRDGMLLIGWSRPVINGHQEKLAVIGLNKPPLTWARRSAAEYVRSTIEERGTFRFTVVEVEV